MDTKTHLMLAFTLVAAMTGCAGQRQLGTLEPMGDVATPEGTVAISRTIFGVSELFAAQCKPASAAFQKSDKFSEPEYAGEMNGRKVYVTYYHSNTRTPVFIQECNADGSAPALTQVRTDIRKGTDNSSSLGTIQLRP